MIISEFQYNLIVALVTLFAIFNAANMATAILIVRKYERYFKLILSHNLFKMTDITVLKIWFVTLSLFVSTGFIILAANNIVTLHEITPDRADLSVKFNIVELGSSFMVFLYHMMLLLDRRK